MIRTSARPWGVDTADFSVRDLDALSEGNSTMRSAIRIMRRLQRLRIPFTFEHPRSSRVWCCSEIKKLGSAPGCQLVDLDQCQYGTRWKKPTTLMCYLQDSQDLDRLRKCCAGRRGVCSRTGRKHFILEGSRCTRPAQAYPTSLARDIAYCLTGHVRALCHDVLNTFVA